MLFIFVGVLLVGLAVHAWVQAHKIEELERAQALQQRQTLSTPSGMPNIDLVDRIQGFYNRAWTMLLVAVGAIAALGTIAVPVVAHRLQQETFARDRKELEQRIELLEAKADHKLNHYAAMFWSEMARGLKTAGWVNSFSPWCYSINSALRAGWPDESPHWVRITEALTPFIDAEPQRGVGRGTPRILADVEETLANLAERPEKEPYATLRRRLQWLIADDAQLPPNDKEQTGGS